MENLDVNAEFWRGRKVFITGHTGFKGGWLTVWLNTLGANVSGYSLAPPTSPNFFDTAKASSGVNSIFGDVRDAATLQAAVRSAAPEVIIHMAAQSLVRSSYADPVSTYSTNVMGTVNLLEAARSLDNLRAVIIVTSDKCYENTGGQRDFCEDNALGGYDPYSSSKACAELVSTAYRASFFADRNNGPIEVATARAGNVIGGGDWAVDRLIPDAIRAFSEGRPVQLRYPGATRPWQHVLDPLLGYILLAEKLCEVPGDYAEAWNFGPSNEHVATVADVVTAAAKRWGPNATWTQGTANHPHEAQFLSIDASKARRRLSWRPKLNLEQAIAWTVDWYSAMCGGADMHKFSEQQIVRYQSA